MPLIRRVPKRGFNNNAFKTRYAIVNLDDLEQFDAGAQVDENALREKGLVRGALAGVKILGNGTLTKALAITADRISAGAKEKIEKAGGTVTLK
jgi:large subunit ribosomal protein L15